MCQSRQEKCNPWTTTPTQSKTYQGQQARVDLQPVPKDKRHRQTACQESASEVIAEIGVANNLKLVVASACFSLLHPFNNAASSGSLDILVLVCYFRFVIKIRRHVDSVEECLNRQVYIQ